MGTSPYKPRPMPQNLTEDYRNVFTAKQRKALIKRFQRLADQRSGTVASSAFLSMPEIVVLPLTRFVVPWFESTPAATRATGTGGSAVASAVAPAGDAGGEHGRVGAGSRSSHTGGGAASGPRGVVSSSGLLTLDGYMSLLAFLSPQTSAQRKHRAVFELLDATGSGVVGLPELAAGLAAIVGPTLPSQAVRETAAACITRGLGSTGGAQQQQEQKQNQPDADMHIDYEGFLRAVPVAQAASNLTVALF